MLVLFVSFVSVVSTEASIPKQQPNWPVSCYGRFCVCLTCLTCLNVSRELLWLWKTNGLSPLKGEEWLVSFVSLVSVVVSIVSTQGFMQQGGRIGRFHVCLSCISCLNTRFHAVSQSIGGFMQKKSKIAGFCVVSLVSLVSLVSVRLL